MGATKRKTAAGIENVNKFEKVIYSQHRKSFSRFVQNYSASVRRTAEHRFVVYRRISLFPTFIIGSVLCFASILPYSLFVILISSHPLSSSGRKRNHNPLCHPFLALADLLRPTPLVNPEKISQKDTQRNGK